MESKDVEIYILKEVMKLFKRIKHLEMIPYNNEYAIKINSLVGRLSLFIDHPQFKWNQFKTESEILISGPIALVPLKRPELYILENSLDRIDYHNFIYISDEIAKNFKIKKFSLWIQEHIKKYFLNSLSVAYILIYLFVIFVIFRPLTTTQELNFLKIILGPFAIIFSLSYYFLRSRKVSSSLLKLCFKFELLIFLLTGILNLLGVDY